MWVGCGWLVCRCEFISCWHTDQPARSPKPDSGLLNAHIERAGRDELDECIPPESNPDRNQVYDPSAYLPQLRHKNTSPLVRNTVCGQPGAKAACPGAIGGYGPGCDVNGAAGTTDPCIAASGAQPPDAMHLRPLPALDRTQEQPRAGGVRSYAAQAGKPEIQLL